MSWIKELTEKYTKLEEFSNAQLTAGIRMAREIKQLEQRLAETESKLEGYKKMRDDLIGMNQAKEQRLAKCEGILLSIHNFGYSPLDHDATKAYLTKYSDKKEME